jgi:uncharacterized damage-inducible protein DinB
MAVSVVELLRRQSELAYAELTTVLKGVTESQAWAVLPQGGSDYLNTDGSIQGVVLHIATCKRIYGSIAFRNGKVRWRDCAEQLESFEPSWIAALDYLSDSQRYWLETWEALMDIDLERDVLHFRGNTWPSWKIIDQVMRHDSYHAGQIAVFRYASSESGDPPMSVAADIPSCYTGLPSW